MKRAERWNTDEIPSDSQPNGKAESPKPVARKLSELVRIEGDSDPDELLKRRYLCRGGALLLAGPTGGGKSSYAMQCALSWGIGRECMGIEPARPLRSLKVQAENDDNDLAEMRDGVLAGLDFTPVQTSTACDSVIICREDSRSGLAFFTECLRPLLIEHKPDLLWIDPVLAYLGGDASQQKDVGRFLRNWLNPLLREFNCGCVILHHVNKPPSGREKPDWSGGDFAYLGAGSAEWANFARAVLAIRATGEQGIFELRAGKRGSRLGWRDAAGDVCFARYIGHSRQPGTICWREVPESEVSKPGRPRGYDEQDMLGLLPPEGLASGEWQVQAESEFGISKRTYFRYRKNLEDQERVLHSKINRRWQPILKKVP